MTGERYPNYEHQAADILARHRALHALDNIGTEVASLRSKLAEPRPGMYVEGSDAQVLAAEVRRVTEELITLGLLAQVRSWDEAHAEREQ
jgi:hypothetical protein